MISPNVEQHYGRLRREHPTMPASHAILWARHDDLVDRTLATVEWKIDFTEPLAIGSMSGGIELVVYRDDESYDWGDDDPTEEERQNLEVIGVGVRLAGEDDVLEDVWGYGFDSRRGECEREAVSCAIDHGFIDAARREISERAYWSARDVETV